MKKYISPITLDLGAKSTGTHFIHYIEGEEPQSSIGKTFVFDTNTFKISLKDRLANRHRMRAQKRRKLAKRLFFLILEKEYGLKEDRTNYQVWDFIRGLFNRRGFTFISEEETDSKDKDTVDNVPWELANYFFPKSFPEGEEETTEGNALEYLKLLASEDLKKAEETWKELKEINFKDETLKNKIKDFIKDYSEIYEKKEVETYLKALKNLSENLYNQVLQGNKYRAVYFKDIKEDIQKNPELQNLLSNSKLDSEKFYRLVAHISNLQLRVLRKYFNDQEMKKGDYWDDARLKKYFLRYVKAWHVKKDKDKQNQKKILAYFQDPNSTVLDFFLNHDPEITIPPYEDQNNRNVVHCQSLLLDAEKMDKHKQFGKIWRQIANKLGRDGANNVLESYDANSIKAVHEELKKSLGGINKKDIPFDEDSILMQRILEESNSASIYRLRLIVKEEKEIKENEIQKLYKDAIENIKARLNEEEIKTLKKIAKKFYKNIEAARLGIWDEEDFLLSKCNSKTTHKNKTQRLQVEQILRIQFENEEQYKKFLKEVWEQPLKGKSTVKSICKNIEDTRKSYGNLFKIEYEKVNRYYQREEGLVPITAEHKEFLSIHQNVKLISEKIFSWLKKENNLLPEKYLETDQSPIKRTLPFANPFSLAQLYNILETDRHGFNKLCKACIIENSWRSRQAESREKEKEMVDRGVRLSADTGRPFDGQIDKILTRLGWEIAQAKVKQIEKHFQDGDSIKIPILMEFNQFNFTEEAYTLKGTGKNSKQWKRLTVKIEKSNQRLLNKDTRIKNDSGGICAYTGEFFFEGDGEIDHILPRSYSLDNFGTVLNSEMNLLYVSRAGNQKKGNQDYSIENIHDKFLQHHFGTTNRSELKERIKAYLEKTLEENQKKKMDYLQVESLEPQERLLLKMGLFYSDLREMILSKIQTHSRTLANGTQVWLFKRLRESLKNLLSKKFPKSTIKIFPHYIGTSEDEFSLKKLRDMLADYNQTYQKKNDKEGQKETSHIIDASLVFAKAILDGKLNLKTPLITDEATPKWLESILPENLEIIPITSKPTYRKSRPYTTPLFKSGMYAERFLSLLIFKEEVKVGFTPELSYPLEMEVAQELFERLKPFLKKGKEFVDKDLTYYQNLETPMRYVLLKIDRQKAKEYLHTCKSDDLVGKTLEGLRYVQQNTDIIKKENNKNKFAVNLENDEEETQEEDSEDLQEGNEKKKNSKSKNKFSNVFSIPDIQQVKSKNIEFTLNLPFKKEWEEIYKKLKGIDLNKDIEEARKIAHEFFHPKKSINNPYNHKTHPRKSSLPLTKSPSGGFRILRKIPYGGKVFQVHETEGHYMGFALENGKVNFGKPIINPIYIQKSTIPYKLEDKQNLDHSKEEVVMFDECRELPIAEEWKNPYLKQVFLWPDTKTRCYIKWVFDMGLVFKNSKKSDLYNIRSIQKFLEVPKPIKDFLEKVNIKPRDKVTITKISIDELAVEYIVNGFPSNLKELYNEGKKVNPL